MQIEDLEDCKIGIGPGMDTSKNIFRQYRVKSSPKDQINDPNKSKIAIKSSKSGIKDH